MNTKIKLPSQLLDFILNHYGSSEDIESYVNNIIDTFSCQNLSTSDVIINTAITLMESPVCSHEISIKEAANFILSLPGINYNSFFNDLGVSESEFRESIEIYFSGLKSYANGKIV